MFDETNDSLNWNIRVWLVLSNQTSEFLEQPQKVVLMRLRIVLACKDSAVVLGYKSTNAQINGKMKLAVDIGRTADGTQT
jgi:hypothetical protein